MIEVIIAVWAVFICLCLVIIWTPTTEQAKGKVIWKGDDYCLVDTGGKDPIQAFKCDTTPEDTTVTIVKMQSGVWNVITIKGT